MPLNVSTVRQVASLAHLQLTPDEESHLAEELNHILAHIETLQQVDTSGVEPAAHASAMQDTLAADVVLPSLSRESVLRCAPDADADTGVFRVPRVV